MVLDSVYRPVRDEPSLPEFSVDAHTSRLFITMRSSKFDVQYADGRAQVTLQRDFTSYEVRALAHALLERANLMDAQARDLHPTNDPKTHKR